MTQLTDDDQSILAALDAVRDRAVRAGGDRGLDRAIYAVRRAVEDRLRQLRVQVAALAEANVLGAQLFEDVEALARELRVQNETLRAHTGRLETAQKEAARVVVALADANVEAAMQMVEVDARREDAEEARKAILADRELVIREVQGLRQQSTALAEANVEMLLTAEAFVEQVDELKARVDRECAEKHVFREQALLDGLTGLYSRRYYEEQLALEFARARRYGRALSVAFLDADHFKQYNDGNGHDAGDHLLAHIARLVRSTVRAVDIVSRAEGDPFAARYGGEEFVVLLPETPLAGAHIVGERIRQAIEQTDFLGGEKQPRGRVTISVGVASLSSIDASGADLVRRADAALYGAKKAGRNRVVVAEEERR